MEVPAGQVLSFPYKLTSFKRHFRLLHQVKRPFHQVDPGAVILLRQKSKGTRLPCQVQVSPSLAGNWFLQYYFHTIKNLVMKKIGTILITGLLITMTAANAQLNA